METILDGTQIEQLLDRISTDIISDIPDGELICMVGIRSRGEVLAQRIQSRLRQKGLTCDDLGAMDITLYRDDLSKAGAAVPMIQITEIPFDIDNRIVILVDDVLNTGRSVRAALSHLMDLGRPKAIRLVVLIDRGNRELPICADYTGMKLNIPPEKKVHVQVHEMDQFDQVSLE